MKGKMDAANSLKHPSFGSTVCYSGYFYLRHDKSRCWGISIKGLQRSDTERRVSDNLAEVHCLTKGKSKSTQDGGSILWGLSKNSSSQLKKAFFTSSERTISSSAEPEPDDSAGKPQQGNEGTLDDSETIEVMWIDGHGVWRIYWQMRRYW